MTDVVTADGWAGGWKDGATADGWPNAYTSWTCDGWFPLQKGVRVRKRKRYSSPPVDSQFLPISGPLVPEPAYNPQIGQMPRLPRDISLVAAAEDRERERAAALDVVKARRRAQNRRAYELLLME